MKIFRCEANAASRPRLVSPQPRAPTRDAGLGWHGNRESRRLSAELGQIDGIQMAGDKVFIQTQTSSAISDKSKRKQFLLGMS